MTTKCKCTTGLDQLRSRIELRKCKLCLAAPRLLELVKKYKKYLRYEIDCCPADAVQKLYFDELSEIEAVMREVDDGK